MTLVPANGSPKINLTPKPARMDVAFSGPKKVFLVPLGLGPDESLDWAPAYYDSKLGADVEILPPVALTPKERDNKRNQYVAEKCIELIQHSYPEEANDPSNIIVGVTSQDIYIAAFDWKYAENLRTEGRLAIVSDARLHPTSYPGIWNKELLGSRLQKMLSKNIVTMCANLPLSNDYTSLLSAGVLSGKQMDYMSEEVVGAEHRWDPFLSSGDPIVSISTVPGKLPVWTIADGWQTDPNPRAEYFMADLSVGLFIQRQIDFYLDEEYPLVFSRMYRNSDDQPRSFGIGTSDSLDWILVGQMGSYIDLVREDGGQTHFVHVDPKDAGGAPQVYQAPSGKAIYEGGTWRLISRDGWTYFFPYRPKFPGGRVTVLTGFVDPQGHKYEMVRNNFGDLLSLTTPSGKWLHFENDSDHRIHKIEDWKGRSVQYDYNAGGQLVRVADSGGGVKYYTYNDRNEMLTVRDSSNTALLTNEYSSNNMISGQTLADGRHFGYSYTFGPQMVIQRNVFKDPNGLQTLFEYDGEGGFLQSLPMRPPQ